MAVLVGSEGRVAVKVARACQREWLGKIWVAVSATGWRGANPASSMEIGTSINASGWSTRIMGEPRCEDDTWNARPADSRGKAANAEEGRQQQRQGRSRASDDPVHVSCESRHALRPNGHDRVVHSNAGRTAAQKFASAQGDMKLGCARPLR